MIAKISTHLPCTAEEIWRIIIEPESLQFICSPILRFKPIRDGGLDDHWAVGKKFELKIYFLMFIPFGHHNIELIKLDKKNNILLSHEQGALARVWNHTILFKEEGRGIRYTDEIEIKAGLLTLNIWLFAHFLYRHRQRRWKKLLKLQNLKQDKE